MIAMASASPLDKIVMTAKALKERSIAVIFRTFSALFHLFLLTRGDAPRCARRLPLAIIFRAFGAAWTEFRLLRQSEANAGKF